MVRTTLLGLGLAMILAGSNAANANDKHGNNFHNQPSFQQPTHNSFHQPSLQAPRFRTITVFETVTVFETRNVEVVRFVAVPNIFGQPIVVRQVFIEQVRVPVTKTIAVVKTVPIF